MVPNWPENMQIFRSERELKMRGALMVLVALHGANAFSPAMSTRAIRSTVSMRTTEVSKAQAMKVIDNACRKLKGDGGVKKQIGEFAGFTNILGFGSPREGVVQVRFNAQFKKKGGTFKTTTGEIKKANRGAMVGQVKAAADLNSGKLMELAVFKDLGYGSSVNVRCP